MWWFKWDWNGNSSRFWTLCLQSGLTKVKVWAVVRPEECSAGFGVNVCSFTDQQLDVGNAPPLYGYMKSSLAWQKQASTPLRNVAISWRPFCIAHTLYLCSMYWCRPHWQTLWGPPSSQKCRSAVPPSRSCRPWGAAEPSSGRFYRRTDLWVGPHIRVRQCTGSPPAATVRVRVVMGKAWRSHKESESFFMFCCRYWCRLSSCLTSLLATASNSLSMSNTLLLLLLRCPSSPRIPLWTMWHSASGMQEMRNKLQLISVLNVLLSVPWTLFFFTVDVVKIS